VDAQRSKEASEVYEYYAYGLTIHSDLPLPELRASAAADADVIVRRGRIAWDPPAGGGDRSHYLGPEGESLFHWDTAGKFRVRGGHEIVVEPRRGVEARVTRLPLLGPVMGALLFQRRTLVLHGSAVEIGGAAVAFVGPKGRGKSTLAAALYARGHNLVGDDVVVIDTAVDGLPAVVPAFPQMKLWPDSALHSLGEDPDGLAPIAAGVTKRKRPVGSRFAAEPSRLDRIYVITDGPELRLERLEGRDAFVRLLGNSYVALFSTELLRGPAAAAHMRQCLALVERVPVVRLERPRDLAQVGRVAEHLAREHAAVAATCVL
jgi:hypothetical protein